MQCTEVLVPVPPFLGPGFRLGACWNRLVETVKTRKTREKNGGKMGEIRPKKCEQGRDLPDLPDRLVAQAQRAHVECECVTHHRFFLGNVVHCIWYSPAHLFDRNQIILRRVGNHQPPEKNNLLLAHGHPVLLQRDRALADMVRLGVCPVRRFDAIDSDPYAAPGRLSSQGHPKWN